MGKLSAEERPVIGQMANEVRNYIEKMISDAETKSKAAEMKKKLEKETLDITMPRTPRKSGHKHPL